METYYVPRTSKRLWSSILDDLIMAIPMAPWIWAIIRQYREGGPIEITLSSVILISLFMIAYEWISLFFFGKTPGQWVMGLRVVPADPTNRKLSGIQSLLRVVSMRVLAFFFGSAPVALMFLKYDRTHPADWIAETRVVAMEPRPKRPRLRWLVAVVWILIVLPTSVRERALQLRETEYRDGKLILTGETSR